MLGSPGATSTVCLCPLNVHTSRKIDPNSRSFGSNPLETVDLASRPIGQVQLLEESVQVVVELLVEMRKQLESQVVVE